MVYRSIRGILRGVSALLIKSIDIRRPSPKAQVSFFGYQIRIITYRVDLCYNKLKKYILFFKKR